ERVPEIQKGWVSWVGGCGCKHVSEERDLTAMDEQRRQRGNEHDHRKRKKHPACILDHDAELGEGAANRADHYAGGKESAKPGRARKEQQRRREKLGYAAGITSPRLKADFAEDVNGLLSAGELEVKGLEENHRCCDATDPTHDEQ